MDDDALGPCGVRICPLTPDAAFRMRQRILRDCGWIRGQSEQSRAFSVELHCAVGAIAAIRTIRPFALRRMLLRFHFEVAERFAKDTIAPTRGGARTNGGDKAKHH
jgi:hypothetical protein